MDTLKNSAAAAGLALALIAGGSGGAARAADLGDAFLEPILPVEIGSSWYLRGDIGYKVYSTPKATYNSFATGSVNYFDQNIDDSWLVGFGAGYQFNPWFRTDITVDYEAPTDFNGNLACLVVCGVVPYTVESGRISAWTILANAYFDLGTWAGLTPYVGGGIGASNVRLSDYTGYNPPFFFPAARAGGDTSTWNFAWALTAGASYDLTANLLLDANYRYVALGDVTTVDQFGGQINIDDIDAHEFRIGVRYLIN